MNSAKNLQESGSVRAKLCLLFCSAMISASSIISATWQALCPLHYSMVFAFIPVSTIPVTHWCLTTGVGQVKILFKKNTQLMRVPKSGPLERGEKRKNRRYHLYIENIWSRRLLKL